MGKEENTEVIDKDKVQQFFSNAVAKHPDINAVLDSNKGDKIVFANIFRDYCSKQFILEYLKPRKEDFILDFGCGVGRITYFLSPRVKKIFGVDASEGMLQTANANLAGHANVSFSILNNQTIPLESAKADKILSSWVLQHVSDEHSVDYFKEFFRVLKPGGKVIIIEQIKNNHQVLSNIHVFRTCEQYLKLAKDAGFNELLTKPVMRVPSRGMSLWNKFKLNSRLLLWLFYNLDKQIINRKPHLVSYYTYAFIFEKPLQ